MRMQDGRGGSQWPLIGRYLALLAVVAVCWGLPIPASAQTEAPLTLTLRGDETPETIRKLVEALSTGGRKVEVRIGDSPAVPAEVAVETKGKPKAADKSAAPPIAPMTLSGSRAEMIWNHFVSGFDYGNASIPASLKLPGDFAQAWSRNINGANTGSAITAILISLTLAFLLAYAFRRATANWFARRSVASNDSFAERVRASSFCLLHDFASIFVWLVAARVMRGFLLPAEDLAMIVYRIAANGAAIGAAYIAIGRFLLAPGAPERRLLPMPRADWHFFLLTIYATATPIVVSSALITQRVASSPDVHAGIFGLTSLALTAFKIWWFYSARKDMTALVLSASDAPGPGLRLLALLTPWIHISFAIEIWAVGRAAPMMAGGGDWVEAAGLTQLIVVLAPILAVGVSKLMASRDAARAAVVEPSPFDSAVRRALRAAVAGLIWAASLYVMARLWAGFLLGVSSTQFAEFTRDASGVAFLCFFGWVALVFLRAFFDAYTPKPVSNLPGDEDAPHVDSVPSRLATVLPVLRGVVLTAVIGLTVLVVLSRMGVDIGPLLAGFGILGLAISFGSQALVRDIVSGFFFMLEDAFRVGEYVDNGKLKGTVEKISLRSMQLRHQSGQIHTVPFGQIASLTNSSRDWATVKFNVRLDHSADIEVARKTIKKTGIAMMEDPEYGPHFIAPLKMQGVADITDSAVVVRLKFTAKPSQASGVQREALKRIYRALNDAKVPFASNAVTVRGGEAREGAAAISTVPPPSPLAP
jgi:small-conductance mechanosensitive channel